MTALHSPRVHATLLACASRAEVGSAAGAQQAARQARAGTPAAGLTASARAAQGKLAARNSRGGRQSRYCLRIELVQRQTVMHYQAARSRSFLRIVVATPNLVAQARGAAPGRRRSGPATLGPTQPCPSLSCHRVEDIRGAPKPWVYNAGPALLRPSPLCQRSGD
jgi:hypothetical protein